MYEAGLGIVAKDYKEAIKWYRLSAEQGDSKAQGRTGFMFYKGWGAAQDNKEAVRWFRLAAEQGNDFGQIALGQIYADGQGVVQDYVRAHMWFNLAAASLSSEDDKIAANSRSAVAAKMTPAQIERAQEMARKCQESNFKDCGW